MSERHDCQPFLNISGVHPPGVGSKTPRDNSLICSHCLHTLTQDHEGLIDVSCLAQTVASRMGVFRAFGTCKVNEG